MKELNNVLHNLEISEKQVEDGKVLDAQEQLEKMKERYSLQNNISELELNSNIIIYTTEDGLSKISTTFDGDTVWLSIDQMAELFQRDKSTISRHIKNVFKDGELMREAVVANFAQTESFTNSPSLNIFLTCLPITLLSL